MKIKNDKYRRARGGWSRILDIRCAKCDNHICFYQKDGPGPLKRLYIDRMSEPRSDQSLVCGKCKSVLGTRTIYEKENRPAFQLHNGSVVKKIIKASKV